MNAFETLGLPASAALSEEQVRAAYFEHSRDAQADRAALNAACELLSAPERRLRHLIEVAGPPEAKQWRAVTMSEDLMAVFLKLGAVRPQAESLIERRAKAASALSRALLERETFALRDELEPVGLEIEARRTALEHQLPAADGDWPRLAALQAQFAYLAKWQTQVRELLLKLM